MVLVPYPLNFCNKKQEIEVGTWVAGIARFREVPLLAFPNKFLDISLLFIKNNSY